ELCQRSCFAGESLRECRIAGGVRRQDLQGNQPIQAGLPRLVHGAHAALAEQLDDFQVRKALAQLFGRRRRERTVIRTAVGRPGIVHTFFAALRTGWRNSLLAVDWIDLRGTTLQLGLGAAARLAGESQSQHALWADTFWGIRR